MIRYFLSLFLLTVSSLVAADDRLGFSTHFGYPSQWPTSLMPNIVAEGASYIRDDLSWASCEKSIGVYALDPQDASWINAANVAGLKVVAILNANPIYTDKWDPTAAAKFCAWLATTEAGKINAIEVVNEPNNGYAAYEGSNWEQKLVTLTTAITRAVHATGSPVQVIGLGAQGSQVLNMLAMGAQVDGLVYHPYYATPCPETVWEPPYYNYAQWVSAIRSVWTGPIFETEWGIHTSSTFSQLNQANFIARRMLEELGLGIAHSFIYEFVDNGVGDLLGVAASPFAPKQSYATVQTIATQLSGVTPQGGVTIDFVANGDTADLYAYAFQGAGKTVIAFWFGNQDPRTPQSASTCNLSFSVPHPYNQSYVLNVISGEKHYIGSTFRWSDYNNWFTIYGVPVDNNPRVIVVPD